MSGNFLFFSLLASASCEIRDVCSLCALFVRSVSSCLLFSRYFGDVKSTRQIRSMFYIIMPNIPSPGTRFYYSNDMQTSQIAPYILGMGKREGMRLKERERAESTSLPRTETRNEETLVQSSATYYRHWQCAVACVRVRILNVSQFAFCILSLPCDGRGCFSRVTFTTTTHV